METTGMVVVEKVEGKSTVTRCFSKYPLKFIVPTKVGSSKTDAAWIYSLSYGGGIVSGDCVSCSVTVGDDCTAVMTTQASTKVYKALGSNCSQQILEARIGRNALFAVLPDPVTCFAAARYSQNQVFRLVPDSNLLIVDWLTSGRHENGERWNFEFYKSTNNIFLYEDEPLFLDSVLLEKSSALSIAESMHNYQVIAMIILVGPKLKSVQCQIQDQVKKMMSGYYCKPAASGYYAKSRLETQHGRNLPALIASCSVFGPKAVGVVIRIAALTTEAVYDFLRKQLMGIEPLIGVSPYC